MPWKEMSEMDQKEEFIILWKTGRYNVTELSEMFSISRPTAYKYINRYEIYGLPGLLELSRAPRHVHNKTPDRIEQAIFTLRKVHPRWGAAKLLVLLEHQYPNVNLPKESTVNLILKRNGYMKERKKRRRIEPQKPLFDPLRPNEIWSADFKGKFRLGNRAYCYPLTIADSFSRYVFAAKGLHAATMKNSKQVFIDTFRKYGLPEQIHTDNGVPFAHANSLGRLSKLAVWFMELGIKPVFSDPAHPEQNGRHERMHRELKAEATKPPGHSLQRQQTLLNRFVKEYNTIRPHAALGMKTPAAVHSFSERAYPETILEWDYPADFKVRYISRNGAIRVGHNNWLFVTTALSGKNVGLEDLGNRIYRLFYRQFFLGYLDAQELKVHDIMTYKNELNV